MGYGPLGHKQSDLTERLIMQASCNTLVLCLESVIILGILFMYQLLISVISLLLYLSSYLFKPKFGFYIQYFQFSSF